jgi:hypothetical protein
VIVVAGASVCVGTPVSYLVGCAIHGEENLAQLHAPMRLNDDDLAPFKGTIASGSGGKSRDMTHDAITDQVCLVVHRQSPRPWVEPGLTMRLTPANDIDP